MKAVKKPTAITLAIAGGAAVLVSCASAPPADAIAGRIVWPRLEKFSSETEFERYLKNVQAARRVTSTYGAADRRVRLAQAETGDAAPAECVDIDCPESGYGEIVVTGARISAPASPSITNNQKTGVDEGDIVKLIGDHLVILQDGRLFSVHLGDSKGAMRVAGRANVYANPEDDAWYDEMVVNRDLIAVFGYSYTRDASEITVFRLSNGAFDLVDKFFISSEDYYDEDNYATRLIGDNLVLYTPIDLYWAARNGSLPERPVIRRAADYKADGEPKDRSGRPLVSAIDIYKPVQTTLRPVLHAVTVCRLGDRNPSTCRTRGVIGSWDREYYVSDKAAYLWLEESGYDAAALISKRGGCENLTDAERRGLHSLAFEIPHSGRAAGFIRVSGEPFDQFSLDTSEKEFRALLSDVSSGQCNEKAASWSDVDYEAAYFSTPLRSFTASGIRPSSERYIETPDPGYDAENRFTETHVVYGARSDWTSYPPEPDDGAQSAKVVAVPVDAPRDYAELTAPHGVIRVERAGDTVVLTGYRDASGLSVSTVDLRGVPKIAGTATLAGRYETEGRSHAFNSLVAEDGSGLMGLPTATLAGEAGRWWWRSESSDVSFLELDGALAPKDVGSLNATPAPNLRTDYDDFDEFASAAPDAGAYQCEVSCIDWYGNSRPIFIGDRVFALTGFELIEGAVKDGRIIEVARIDVTKAPRP